MPIMNEKTTTAEESFNPLNNDNDFYQAGVIILIALFCRCVTPGRIVFTPWLCLLMARAMTCVNDNLINKTRHF